MPSSERSTAKGALVKVPAALRPAAVNIFDHPARFPVRRIFCVGQNYADHAAHAGDDAVRPQPFFFTKPCDAVVASGSTLAFPRHTQDLHHEVELVVALGAGGADIDAAEARSLIYGWGVGLDLTRRDLQAAARKAGQPWDMAKGFDQSAPVGTLMPGMPPSTGAISCRVNGVVRQRGDVADMIWSVAEIIAALSSLVDLSGGDLIFTGTPAGVGPLVAGDTVQGTVAGAPSLYINLQH